MGMMQQRVSSYLAILLLRRGGSTHCVYSTTIDMPRTKRQSIHVYTFIVYHTTQAENMLKPHSLPNLLDCENPEAENRKGTVSTLSSMSNAAFIIIIPHITPSLANIILHMLAARCQLLSKYEGLPFWRVVTDSC